MNQLWNFLKMHLPVQYVNGAFLTVWIAAWTLSVLAVGVLFCSAVAGASPAVYLVKVICIAGYAGVIFGLFGGMFFLMRRSD